MTDITQFILSTSSDRLSIKFQDDQKFNLSFEYIRVFSPQKPAAKPGASTVVSHKKQVKLLKIESVGKHGYRLIFDDQHQAIYSQELLLQLCLQQESNWQQYLDEIQAGGHSREAMINFTEVT